MEPGPAEQEAAARIAANVRAEIGRARFTPRRLAARAEMDPVTLHRRLKGDPPGFRVHELENIAAVLGVNITTLLGTAAPTGAAGPQTGAGS